LEFKNKKELKSWFKSLSPEEKKSNGKFYNEKIAEFEKPSHKKELPYPHNLTYKEFYEYNWCHRCGHVGYLTGFCRCWEFFKKKYCPLWGIPVGYFFILNDEWYIKDKIESFRHIDTDITTKIDDYPYPLVYRFNLDLLGLEI